MQARDDGGPACVRTEESTHTSPQPLKLCVRRTIKHALPPDRVVQMHERVFCNERVVMCKASKGCEEIVWRETDVGYLARAISAHDRDRGLPLPHRIGHHAPVRAHPRS
eukprot:scaffold156539_cov26-Tisochrysis_lutea.AAC.5